jgi:hypothetical protein
MSELNCGHVGMKPSALKAHRPTAKAALESALKECKTREKAPGKAAPRRP